MLGVAPAGSVETGGVLVRSHETGRRRVCGLALHLTDVCSSDRGGSSGLVALSWHWT